MNGGDRHAFIDAEQGVGEVQQRGHAPVLQLLNP
jgi:hypothetical protein